ncbi:218_t:CDS:1, partial [Funneliformis geosporum]
MAIDKLGGHIDILTTLQYLTVERNILFDSTLYVIFSIGIKT